MYHINEIKLYAEVMYLLNHNAKEQHMLYVQSVLAAAICQYNYDLWLFLIVPWIGLQCVIVVFPDHTHLLLAPN